jgi:putative ABC transport system permease protein
MMSSSFDVEGQSRPEVNTAASINIASPGYFQTMGVPLISGRTFTSQDTAEAPKVVMLNPTCVRKFFPGENPVGKHIKIPDAEGWATIVGVVGDVRQSGLASLPEPEIIEPYLQVPNSYMTLVIRTSTDPLSLVPALRSQVQSLDRDLPMFEVSTMEQYLAEEMAGRRFNMVLLGIFAGLALILAVVGIYGILAYIVTQQTHEIGIRMAMGAQRRDMLLFILRRGVRLTLIGVAIGLPAAWVVTRVMSSLLYGVSPRDPLTFIGMTLLLVTTALLASYIPARRATKVDPMVALRYE